MTYAEQWTLVTSDAFKGRISMALLSAALEVQDEDTSTDFYSERRAMAVATIIDPTQFTYQFVYIISGNAAISAGGPVDSLDSDIDSVIASNWTLKALDFAG